MPGRKFSSSAGAGEGGYRYGFNGQEKSTEIDADGNSMTAEFWQYDARLGRRWNLDPIPKFYESGYAAFANNPIWFTDVRGADTTKYHATTKLSGSKNPLIVIKEVEGKISERRMKNKSGDWDYLVVMNMQEAEQILKKEYGKNTGFIENLIVKSHGHASDNIGAAGPDLDSRDKMGIVRNPDGIKSLLYIRSLLTNKATVMFTACSTIQGFMDPTNKKGKEGLTVLMNYSRFWLKGTHRNLFMNNTKTTSVRYKDKDGDKEISDDEEYWFKFDEDLIADEQKWSGFVWQYYDSKGNLLRQPNFQQIKVDSDGRLRLSRLSAITPNKTDSNREPPQKKNL